MINDYAKQKHTEARITERNTRAELVVPFRFPETKPAVEVVQQTHGRGKQSILCPTRHPIKEEGRFHKSEVRIYICLDLRPGRITGLMFRNRNGVRLLGRLFGSGGAMRFFERRAAWELLSAALSLMAPRTACACFRVLRLALAGAVPCTTSCLHQVSHARRGIMSVTLALRARLVTSACRRLSLKRFVQGLIVCKNLRELEKA